MPGFEPDFYSCLGVSKGATPEEIKKAYRNMSRLPHPDKICQDGGNKEAIDLAIKILALPEFSWYVQKM